MAKPKKREFTLGELAKYAARAAKRGECATARNLEAQVDARNRYASRRNRVHVPNIEKYCPRLGFTNSRALARRARAQLSSGKRRMKRAKVEMHTFTHDRSGAEDIARHVNKVHPECKATLDRQKHGQYAGLWRVMVRPICKRLIYVVPMGSGRQSDPAW